MNKQKVATHADFVGSAVLQELKEGAGEYLPFVSSEVIVCDACGLKLRLLDLPQHVEYVHYDPPQRVWSKGAKVGWRRGWRQI